MTTSIRKYILMELANDRDGAAPRFLDDIRDWDDEEGKTMMACDGGCGFTWEPKHLRMIGGRLLCWPCSMKRAREEGICLDPSVWEE